METTPNISGIIREVRETLGFLVTTKPSFRRNLVLYGTILYLFFSKQSEIAEFRKEREQYIARDLVKEEEHKKNYNAIMVLWKQDVQYFSDVFREMQKESSRIKLETEKLNTKEEK